MVDIIILGMAMTTTATEIQGDTMIHEMTANTIQTPRTYSTFGNAKAKLIKAIEISGHKPDAVRWMIGVADDGRFAPVVIGANDRAGQSNMDFIHIGVTVVG